MGRHQNLHGIRRRGVVCTTVHRPSDAGASVIVDVAESHDVDLIVMGEPARTTLLEPTR